MGTCAKEKSPLVVYRGQHFRASNIHLTCSAAPIFDSQGQLAAVLDLTSGSSLQQHSAVLVSMAAQMIENRTFLSRHKQDYVIRFHTRPEFLNTLHEGQIALSGEGKVLAANRSALFQLGFNSHDEICGSDISQLFHANLTDLIARTVHNSFHSVPLHGAEHGGRFFAVAQRPARTGQQFPDVIEQRVSRNVMSATPSLPNESPLKALGIGDARMAVNVDRALRVLNRNIPVLLSGETGTGKDVFARAVHAASKRAPSPFVAVNCASLPESLIESELFGYKSGAFTGANREGRRGKIIQANGGTLFLDEIGDMPLNLQARLLRVLEEREVVPLGSEIPVPVDIQLISASHRNLQEMVRKGELREDLYYRLQGIVLVMPALRDRTDKRQLIERCFKAETEPGHSVTIDPKTMSLLESYHWPGNIRQLRNVLRTALALREGNVITMGDLPADLLRAEADGIMSRHGTAPAQFKSAMNPLECAERDALIQELERDRWNITNLARRLNTSRNAIYRKMKRLNIKVRSRAFPTVR